MGLFKRYESGNRAMSIYVTIKCNGKKRFRSFAMDAVKINSFYADRYVEVDGERTIYFSFPISPMEIIIGIVNAEDGKDENYTFSIEERSLRNYNIWMDSETSEFVQLAEEFSQRCGYEVPGKGGQLYTTPDHYYNIKYFQVLADMNGNQLTTPARVGHRTGIIEAAYVYFKRYTIPARMAILLHEFSHKYKNPKMNLEIGNEIGADINALYIYLGLGFSKIDAICVFANVFLKAQTDDNIVRMRKIKEYIGKFENQEFAKAN